MKILKTSRTVFKEQKGVDGENGTSLVFSHLDGLKCCLSFCNVGLYSHFMLLSYSVNYGYFEAYKVLD